MWIVPISILHQLALVSLFCLWLFHLMIPASSIASVLDATFSVDCKTVCIFAYSSMHEQSNKRSGTRLKIVRLLRHALPISLLILRKKPTVLQSTFSAKSQGFSFKGAFTDKHLHKNSEKQWNVYIQKEMFTPYYALLSMIFSFPLHFCFLEVSLYYHLCRIYFTTSSGTYSHLFYGFSPSPVLMHYLVQIPTDQHMPSP